MNESDLDSAIEKANQPARAKGSSRLRSFGLVLHHDGRWSHEGQPIRNRRLREKFDESVRFLPDEGGVYVVQIGRFRGLIDVEEAAFFVEDLDLGSALVRLSDASSDTLDVASLSTSGIDGALLCRIKRNLDSVGVLARFSHRAHAEFLNAVDDEGITVSVAGSSVQLPPL